MKQTSLMENLRQEVYSFKRASHVVLASVAFLFLLIFASLAASTTAVASEDTAVKSTSSIDWCFTNPNPLITNSFSSAVQADSDNQTSKDGSRVAMYRFYNKWTGEHFYTSSIKEKNDIEKAGWSYEHVGWYAPTDTNLKPVYRLYNSYVEGGDHHYTSNTEERDTCIKAGWKDEGIAWYTVEASTAAETDETDVYRQYNPNAETGTHNYTMSKKENDDLVKAGWKAEGTAWRGYSVLEASISEIDFSKATVDTADKTYSAKQIKPTVTIAGLTAGTDYTVAYGTNKDVATGGTITITGIGKYTGSKTYTFKITALDITNATIELGDSLTYKVATTQTQSVKSVKVGSLTVPATEYTVTNNEEIKAGTYTLSVTGKSNYKGTATKDFVIAKANPTYPDTATDARFTGLTATAGDKLSVVTLPQITAEGDYTDGKFVWVNSEASVGDTAGTIQADAKFVPNDTKNYNDSSVFKLNITVEAAKLKATFVANAPTGMNATVDGSAQKVVKLDYDASTTEHTIVTADFPTEVKITDSDTKNWVFAGWSTNQSDTVKKGIAEDQIVGTKLTSDVTYYAIWLEARGYWLGTKGADATYVDEAYFATHDDNYVSGSTIAEDIGYLQMCGGQSNYDIAKKKWDGYYDNADSTTTGVGYQVRLYATYTGGEKENSCTEGKSDDATGPASDLNKYVEFRILEVSGKDGHKNYSGTSDGSVVTFMATHALPTCYKMREADTASNVGGWGSADNSLRTYMQEGGSIYNKFSSAFTNKIKSVTKEYHTGNGAAVDSKTDISTISDKFWILSYAECAGSSFKGFLTMYEGTQYAWCKTNVTKPSGLNPSLNLTTRAGATPGNSFTKICYWYLRSPSNTTNKFADVIYYVGTSSSYQQFNASASDAPRGVVLCFSF